MTKERLDLLLNIIIILCKQEKYQEATALLSESEQATLINGTVNFSTKTKETLVDLGVGLPKLTREGESDEAFSADFTQPLIAVPHIIKSYVGKTFGDDYSLTITGVVGITAEIHEKQFWIDTLDALVIINNSAKLQKKFFVLNQVTFHYETIKVTIPMMKREYMDELIKLSKEIHLRP